MKAIVIFLIVVRSNLLFSDTLDLWQNPIDTINPMVVFRGNFNYFENCAVVGLGLAEITNDKQMEKGLLVSAQPRPTTA